MDFSLILFAALVLTGIIALLDSFISRSKRGRSQAHSSSPESNSDSSRTKKTSGQSVIVEYARAFFPVILLVFVLRSFVVEPFRIPSGSMLPTLYIGDFILVEKFRYGIRLPIINITVIPTRAPKRGEVMVFRYPHDNSTNFIKRVIGIPGDVIIYDQKRLSINGVEVRLEKSNNYQLENNNQELDVIEYSEVVGDSIHSILNDRGRLSRSMKITVPENSYFVMGDNRDHSNDSRFWGFVPENNIVGRAFLVWFSWNSDSGGVNWPRIGHKIP